MSLRSMTGFGRARGPVGSDRSGEVVIRSVNSRFLDLTIKTKEAEAALEPALRRTVGALLHRQFSAMQVFGDLDPAAVEFVGAHKYCVDVAPAERSCRL